MQNKHTCSLGRHVEVDLGPLDPLQYPTLVIDALQQEVQTVRSQWRTEVSELEAVIKKCAKESKDLPVVQEMLEFMTSRFEGLLVENADLKKQAILDIQELEGMVQSLTTENGQLKKKISILEPMSLNITGRFPSCFEDKDRIALHEWTGGWVKDLKVCASLTNAGVATPPLYEPNAEPNAEPVAMTPPVPPRQPRFVSPRFVVEIVEPNAEPAAERTNLTARYCPGQSKGVPAAPTELGKDCGEFFGKLEQTMSSLAVDTEKLMDKLKHLQAKVAKPETHMPADKAERLKHSDTASTRFTWLSQDSNSSLCDDLEVVTSPKRMMTPSPSSESME